MIILFHSLYFTAYISQPIIQPSHNRGGPDTLNLNSSTQRASWTQLDQTPTSLRREASQALSVMVVVGFNTPKINAALFL